MYNSAFTEKLKKKAKTFAQKARIFEKKKMKIFMKSEKGHVNLQA